MQARMPQPVVMVPEAMRALRALGKAAHASGDVPMSTHRLVELRASQLNGCSVCVEMHAREMREAGETDERIVLVSAWRDAPVFTEAERAALALTEAVTRLSDVAEPVPDTVWAAASRHYDEAGLAGLLLTIAGINAWNRLNIATRQVAGAWRTAAAD